MVSEFRYVCNLHNSSSYVSKVMEQYVIHIKPFFLPVGIQHTAHPVSVPRNILYLDIHSVATRRADYAVVPVVVDLVVVCIILKEIQALWSQNHNTSVQRYRIGMQKGEKSTQ